MKSAARKGFSSTLRMVLNLISRVLAMSIYMFNKCFLEEKLKMSRKWCGTQARCFQKILRKNQKIFAERGENVLGERPWRFWIASKKEFSLFSAISRNKNHFTWQEGWPFLHFIFFTVRAGICICLHMSRNRSCRLVLRLNKPWRRKDLKQSGQGGFTHLSSSRPDPPVNPRLSILLLTLRTDLSHSENLRISELENKTA